MDWQPGDVVLTRTPGLAGRLIRLGAGLMDKPNLRNHVVIVHHADAGGTIWGIEGRPGGVGWVDLQVYLNDQYTVSNWEQPKTHEQRTMVAEVAKSMLQTPYDWSAIAVEAMRAIKADLLWRGKDFGDKAVPGQVICSSLADYIYEKVGLASPGAYADTRWTAPWDWDEFILTRGWRYSTAMSP